MTEESIKTDTCEATSFKVLCGRAATAWRKIRFILPWLLSVLFTVGVGMLAARHEMWRDEIQAWLLSRDATSPWALLHNMRYEGHPGLWHLILWPVAQLTWNPAAMQVVHVLIAGASAFILLRFSPFPFFIKIMILCGYFFAYEWAVISRNYAISVVILFSICALFEKRWKRFPYIAGLFFLLCHTNIHSIIVTIVLTVFLMIEFAVAYAAKARSAHLYIRRVAVGLLIILAGLATGIKQTAPPEDSGFATTWTYKWTKARRNSTANRVIRALLPVPPDRPAFWNSNRFLIPNKDSPNSEPAVPVEKHTRYGVALLLLLTIPFFKRPWPGLAYICISFALLSFFYIKYPGSMRHHGFLYLSLITMLWMSYHYTPWKLKWRVPENILSFADKYRVLLFLPIFAVQIWGACVAIKYEWNETFSAAKEAAEWIGNEYPDPGEVIYAAPSGPYVTAVVGYLQAESFFYLDSGDFGSYVTWDKSRRGGRNLKTMRKLAGIAKEDKKPVLFVATGSPARNFAQMKSTKLASFRGAIEGSENCTIYLLEHRD